MACYKWLQLSDIHFTYNNIASTDIRNSFKDRFFGEHFDFIFLTGDFSYRNNFDDTTCNFVKDLIHETTCPMDHVFLVPGNHDINRSSMRTRALSEIKNVQKTDPIMLYTFDMGAQGYRDFCKKVMGEEYAKTCTDLCIVTTFPDYRLDVVQVNTCLTSYGDDDKDHLYICSDIIQGKLAYELNRDHIQIVIGHHGFDFLADSERKIFTDWLIQYTNTKLYLCGHEHQLGIRKFGSATQIVCGSMLNDQYSECGCVAGTIDTVLKKIDGKCFCYTNSSWQVSNESNGRERSFNIVWMDSSSPFAIEERREKGKDSELSGLFLHQLEEKEFLVLNLLKYSSIFDTEYDFSSVYHYAAPLWRSTFSTKEYSLAMCLADKIYLVFSENSNFSLISDLPLMIKNGAIDSEVTKQWRMILSILSGTTYDDSSICTDLGSLFSAFIKPIEQNIGIFKKSLSKYIVHPNYLTKQIDICGYFSGIKDQIERDETEFKLRIDEIKWIQNAWQEGKGQYLLLEASEGFGKTLLCSHLLYTQANTIEIDGSGSKAGVIAPWLPNMLCVFGKSAKTPKRAFQLLMAQINAMLVNPVKFDEQSNYADILTFALSELVYENGNVLFIIDAMDEFVQSNNAFGFLPLTLPQGVTALLTMRKENGIRKLLEELLTNTQSKSLMTFRKQEIPIILGLSKVQKEDPFIRMVIKKTNGIPILVSQAAKVYSIYGKGTIDNIDPTIDSYFMRMRLAWLNTPICKAVLMLLVIAESIERFQINMELLLLWVRVKTENEKVDSDEIRMALLTVQDQLDNPESGWYGLRYHGLAESMVGTKGYTSTLSTLKL